MTVVEIFPLPSQKTPETICEGGGWISYFEGNGYYGDVYDHKTCTLYFNAQHLLTITNFLQKRMNQLDWSCYNILPRKITLTWNNFCISMISSEDKNGKRIHELAKLYMTEETQKHGPEYCACDSNQHTCKSYAYIQGITRFLYEARHIPREIKDTLECLPKVLLHLIEGYDPHPTISDDLHIPRPDPIPKPTSIWDCFHVCWNNL